MKHQTFFIGSCFLIPMSVSIWFKFFTGSEWIFHSLKQTQAHVHVVIKHHTFCISSCFLILMSVSILFKSSKLVAFWTYTASSDTVRSKLVTSGQNIPRNSSSRTRFNIAFKLVPKWRTECREDVYLILWFISSIIRVSSIKLLHKRQVSTLWK